MTSQNNNIQVSPEKQNIIDMDKSICSYFNKKLTKKWQYRNYRD